MADPDFDSDYEDHYNVYTTSRKSAKRRAVGTATTDAAQSTESHRPAPESGHICVACRNVFLQDELIALDCNDHYCGTCLRDFFIHATTNESIFTPRCCSQIIPIAYVRPHITKARYVAFNKAQREFAVTNRTYCYLTACAQFIEPKNIKGTRAWCTKSKRYTCTLCKKKDHQGRPCDDEGTKALAALAAKNR